MTHSLVNPIILGGHSHFDRMRKKMCLAIPTDAVTDNTSKMFNATDTMYIALMPTNTEIQHAQ